MRRPDSDREREGRNGQIPLGPVEFLIDSNI